MKNVCFLVLNILGSCVAFSRPNKNQNEGLNPDKDNFLDLTVLLDDKDDSMKVMFESPSLGENSKDLNGSNESGLGEIEMFGEVSFNNARQEDRNEGSSASTSGETGASTSSEKENLPVKRKKVKPIRHMDTGCACEGLTCGCCLDVGIGKLSGEACIDVELLKEEMGLKVAFVWQGEDLYSHEVSVSNPPPICFAHPLFRLIKVCAKLSDISVDNDKFGGCISLQLRLALVAKDFELGCFYTDDPSTLGPKRDKHVLHHHKNKKFTKKSYAKTETRKQHKNRRNNPA